MATRSLGTLTLDLIAKVGGFEQGMGKAEKRTQKFQKEVKNRLAAAGKAFGVFSTVANSALAVMAVKTVNAAQEVKNFSELTNTATDEFQRYAYAAKTVGVEQDKLADIFKDTSDKVGDFLQTGGGALADFFENIAPQVGVTAEQFRDLSGPQALGLYVDSLEKANLSQSEMTFYLEAIASDATLLLPLLRNNSSELNRLGEEAENIGAVISDIDLEKLGRAKQSLDTIAGAYRGLSAEVVAGALPVIQEFSDVLTDPDTLEAASDLANALVVSFSAATKAIRETIGVTKFLAEEAAAITAGPSADDIVRLQEWSSILTEMLDTPTSRIRFFGKDGIVKIYSPEEIEKELDQTNALINQYYDNAGNVPEVPVKIEPEPIDTTDLRFDEVAAELEKEFGNIDVGLQDILGDLDAEFAEEAAQRVADALRDYQDLVRDLRTDEEVLTDQVRERLAALEAVAGLTDEQRNQTLGRIADAATVDAPEFSGGDTTEAQAELEDWYATQLDLLKDFRKERADLNATWNEEELAVKQEYEERLNEITTANEEMRRQQMLDGYSAILGVVGSFYEGMEGEEAAYARAAIAIGQTLLDEKKRNALQSIIASTQSAAMGAYESLASIPYIGPFLGAAAAGGIYIAGGLAAAEVSGLAHDGIDSIPEDGTWLLEKGERVTTAETSAKLDRTLANIEQGMGGNNRSMGGGGNTYNYNVAGNLNRETAAQAARESERRQRMTARRLGA